MPKAVFALVDCNNFFVSCERAFRPDLEHKPVAVLSSNDGCFVSRSNEVKKVGIPMGAPLFQYKDIVQKNNIQLFSGNFSLYRDLSNRVMQTLGQFADDMEIYSIDEAFLQIPWHKSLASWGLEVKSTVRQWARIPVSIGIGPTKVLAKLASHIAKSTPECGGVFDASTKNIDDILACLPVSELWGIGRKHSAFLISHGIETVLDFKNCDDGWVRKNLTVHGLQLLHELRGTVCYPLFQNPGPQKSLVHSRTFGRPVESLEMLKKVITDFAIQAAHELRSRGQVTAQLTVYIRTKRYLASGKFVASLSVPLVNPTDFTPELVQAAVRAVERIYVPGYRYAKAGISCTALTPGTVEQQNLFTVRDTARQKRLMRAVDTLNERYGSHAVSYAATLGDQPWKVRREHRSPRFTTHLDEIPVVH